MSIGTFAEKTKKKAARIMRRSIKNTPKRTGSQKEKRVSRLSYALCQIAHAAAGLILGLAELPFSVCPCGTALVFASEKYSFGAYIGASLACIGAGSEAGAFFAVNTLAMFLRAFISASALGFSDSKKTRLAASAALSVLCGGIMAFVGGFEPAFILRGASYAIFLPAVTWCLCSVSGKKGRGVMLDGAFCALAFISVYALSDVHLGVLSLSLLLAAEITLFASRSGGTLYGLLFGLLCGAAMPDAAYIFPCGAAGFAAGMFSDGKKTAARCISFLCVFSALSLYIVSDGAYGAICSAFAASLLYIPLSELAPGLFIKERFPTPSRIPEKNGLEKIAGAFTSLSDIVYNITDKLRYPSEAEIREKTNDILYSYCGNCAMYEHCYSRKLYKDKNIEETVISRLSSGGLKKSDLPDKYAESCIRLSEIVEKLNDGYAELVNEHFRDNKTEILASEYSTMARLIKYTSQKEKTDTFPDRALYDAANAALSSIGLRFSSLAAYGGRTKTVEVHGVHIENFPCTSEELANYMSEKCGVLFGEPEYIGTGEKMIMKLTRKRKLRLEYARCAYAKGGGAVNGDSVSFFESDEDYFYALISDGMGSGRSAALTSRLTSVFIEKLLTTGAHKNVTLELLNNLLLSKNDESFATVDLLEVDLLSGEASFVKAGAAPAYIVRASKLYKIASFTPPAGIIRSFSAENTRFSLERGDTVLMLSDGIVQSSDEAPWLCEMLSFDTADDPAHLAEKILAKARKINVRDDDMTCVAVRVM